MYEAEYEYIQFGTIENINININKSINENTSNNDNESKDKNIDDLPISSKITIIPNQVIPIIIATTTTTNIDTNIDNNLSQSNVCFIKKTYNFIFNILMSCLCMIIMINVYYALL